MGILHMRVISLVADVAPRTGKIIKDDVRNPWFLRGEHRFKGRILKN